MTDIDRLLAALAGMPQERRDQVLEEAVKHTSALKWVPNPGPQTQAYYCEADELFYGGQAGGGKSDLGIGLGLTAHRRSLILREYKEDARKLNERLLEIVGDRAGWSASPPRYKTDKRIVEFDGMPNEKDKQRKKGDPHDLIVFDEIVDFFESQYRFVIGWNRTTVQGQRCRVVCTGNPPTRSKGLWVMTRWGAWLDPAHPRPALDGELRWYIEGAHGEDIEVDGPGEYPVGLNNVQARSRTFIRAQLEDNPDLAASDYGAVLDSLPVEIRDAYRHGKFENSMRDAPRQTIPTQWIVEAQKRWTPAPPRGVPMCAIGVDPAGGGDDDVCLAPRYDGYFATLVVENGRKVPLGRDIAALVITNRRDGATINLDMGGGYGGSTFEHLTSNNIEVNCYEGAKSTTRRTADRKLKFANRRSAAYWLLREGLDPGQPGGSPIALPPDPLLVSDLTCPQFDVTPHGIQITPKKKVCELLGRSPNRGDAVVMAWDGGPKATTEGVDFYRTQSTRPDQRVETRGGSGHRGYPKVDYGPRHRARA